MPKINFTTKDMDLDEKPKKKFEPGDYHFKITLCDLQIEDTSGVQSKWESVAVKTPEELAQLSGSRTRLSLALECWPLGAPSYESFSVLETIWFTEKAAWKYKQFCNSLKLNSDENLDTDVFWDKEGLVYLSRKGDDKYLTVRKFLTESKQIPANPSQVSASPVGEDVPF